MSGFIEGCDRQQKPPLRHVIDDNVGKDCTARLVADFIDGMDLFAPGLEGALEGDAETGRRDITRQKPSRRTAERESLRA